MLHDIPPIKTDISVKLMRILSAQKNTELYEDGNKYSIIYPNKQYHGEIIKSK